jgi:hypothetical protein
MDTRHRYILIIALLAITLACGQIGSNSVATPTPSITRTPTSTATPESVICADDVAVAFAWEDLDSDGVHDSDEPPLAGVCIHAYREEEPDEDWLSKCAQKENPNMYSDSSGMWWSDFMFGHCGTAQEIDREMAKECKRIHITAYSPDGYRATTDTTINDCKAAFGFAKLSTPTP